MEAWTKPGMSDEERVSAFLRLHKVMIGTPENPISEMSLDVGPMRRDLLLMLAAVRRDAYRKARGMPLQNP